MKDYLSDIGVSGKTSIGITFRCGESAILHFIGER